MDIATPAMAGYTDLLNIPIGLAVIGTALTFYFLPAIVASERRHKEGYAIFILNLFTGWTFIGWLAALVWAWKAR